MARIENERKDLKTYGVDPEELAFYVVGAGAANPTFGAGCPGNMVTSITRTAVGKYTIQLAIPVQLVIAKYADPDDLASPDGSWATLGNVANEGTTTGLSFQLSMFTPGGAYAQQPLADIAAARKVRIVLRLQRTKWGVMT